jgi:hypothetical protein
MPVLPLIDLMIFLAWSSLIVAFVEKSLELALARNFWLFGITPFDWVVIAATSLLFALALAARSFVKATEGSLSLRFSKTAAEVLPDFPDPRAQQGFGTTVREREATPTRIGAR